MMFKLLIILICVSQISANTLIGDLYAGPSKRARILISETKNSNHKIKTITRYNRKWYRVTLEDNTRGFALGKSVIINKSIPGKPPKPENLVTVGIIQVISGMVAGTVTIVDANKTEVLTLGEDEYNLENEWNRGHTISISLSIGMIVSGISTIVLASN